MTRVTFELIYQKAIELLSRREHSKKELLTKLKTKFPFNETDTSVLEAVCARLVEQSYLSDERFTEAYIRARLAKGFGTARVIQELKARGVDEALTTAKLQTAVSGNDKRTLLYRLWQKKFGEIPCSAEQKAKQMRFFYYRGFNSDEISHLYSALDADEVF